MANKDNKAWLDTSLSPKERAIKLVAAMDLDQKIAQLHGGMRTVNIYNMDAMIADLKAEAEAEGRKIDKDQEMDLFTRQIQVERHVPEMKNLDIPRFRITNGPVGVGMGDGHPSPKATALPMAIGLAASFNRELASEYGDIIGSETATLGQHVLEGPAVNLHRTPIAGRNFEYFSEDPYLSGVMGVEVTKSIQQYPVIAMGKHYAVNDQEHERFRVNVELEENVLRELYLLPFEMLVKDGDIAALMSAYNRVRGTYASENRYLLNDILRKEWGFEGYVQSDFWGTRSAAASLAAGQDHEMPDGKWYNEENIKAALEDTSLEIETVDRALVRRFTQMFRFGHFEQEYNPGVIDAKAHGARSRKIGQESAVLLKNDNNILPLDPHAYDNVLIVGQSRFVDFACNGGGGSSKVDPLYEVHPQEGMQNVLEELGSKTKVNKFTVTNDLSNLEEAKEVAKNADAVIIMAGIVATEGEDLEAPIMYNNQDKMVEELLASSKTTVVVMKNSTPIIMPWRDQAQAILEVWNQGSEDGHVVADLVFGKVNPSGKVPTTYPANEEQLIYNDHPERHPGIDEGEGYPTIRYSEGLEMGYRWFHAKDITPQFAFGYGLSYTDFEINNVKTSITEGTGKEVVDISAKVTNTGKLAGAEVVQVYLGIPSEGQPPKRLVGFEKVYLEAGEAKEITISIDPKATNHPFGVWDKNAHDFIVKPGDYIIYVGNASDSTPDEIILTIQ